MGLTDLAEGEDEPVKDDLHTKQSKKAPKEEIWKILYHADRYGKESKLQPCKAHLDQNVVDKYFHESRGFTVNVLRREWAEIPILHDLLYSITREQKRNFPNKAVTEHDMVLSLELIIFCFMKFLV